MKKQLNQLGKLLLESETTEDREMIQNKVNMIIPNALLTEIKFEDIQDEISFISLSRNLLETKLEQTIKEMNQLHETQVVA